MLMFLLGAILLELSYIGMLTTQAAIRAERLRNAAESGVERAVQILKERKGIVPSSPDNIINYTSPDGEIEYNLEIYKKDQMPPNNDMYYITSKASSNNGRYFKAYVVRIDIASFKRNFFTDSLCAGGLTVLGDDTSCFVIPVTSSISLQCPLYLQCSRVTLPFSRIKSHRTIAINADFLEVESQPLEKYQVYADIPENNLEPYKNYISSCKLDYYHGICMKAGESENKLSAENLAVIKRLNGSTVCLSDIEKAWRSIRSSMAVPEGIVSTDLRNKLSQEDMKQLAAYVNENTAYKLIIINGSLTIPEGRYNNYIICCSGSVSFDDNVELVNSSLLCTGVALKENSRINISCPARTILEPLMPVIANELNSCMDNYSDGTEVKFLSWYDL